MRTASRVLGLLGVLVLATLLASPAEAKVKTTRKKQHHFVRGVVVSVEKDGNKGLLTIRTHHHKPAKARVTKNAIKPANGAAKKSKGHVHTVHFGQNTKFHGLTINNAGTISRRALRPADIKQGDHVIVRSAPGHPHQAQVVSKVPTK